MPMIGSALAAMVVNAQSNPNDTPASKAKQITDMTPFCQAIIDYFVANAVIIGIAPPGTSGGPITGGRIT